MKPENAKPNPKAHGVCDSTYTKYTGQAKPQKRDADGEAGGGAAQRARAHGRAWSSLLERRERSGIKQL